MNDAILITGLSGLIGRALHSRVIELAPIRALNRSEVEGVDCIRASIDQYDDIRAAFNGVETVVHLAAKAGERYSWEELNSTNILGTYNVLRAASDAGCKRLIFASSGATVSGYEAIEPYKTLVSGEYSRSPTSWKLIDHNSPTWPSGIYGSTKVWGESICRHFADKTDLSVHCVRIGYVNRDDRPSRPRDWAIWCSQRDIVSALMCGIQASAASKFATYFVTSRNQWGYRDLSHTENIIGFVPQDEAEQYR